jgi:hypothetical protein
MKRGAMPTIAMMIRAQRYRVVMVITLTSAYAIAQVVNFCWRISISEIAADYAPQPSNAVKVILLGFGHFLTIQTQTLNARNRPVPNNTPSNNLFKASNQLISIMTWLSLLHR